MGYHALLQGSLLTQGSNLHLLVSCISKPVLYQPVPPGKPFHSLCTSCHILRYFILLSESCEIAPNTDEKTKAGSDWEKVL